jgi:aminoglycoside phosphotransferase (APT) family kinase protein
MPASSVRKAATTIRNLPSAAGMTLINRDYHPGNTMRSRRRLTAIADWAQASSAPPDRDAGHMRR